MLYNSFFFYKTISAVSTKTRLSLKPSTTKSDSQLSKKYSRDCIHSVENSSPIVIIKKQRTKKVFLIENL